MKCSFIFLAAFVWTLAYCLEENEPLNRVKRLVPVFQVVRFPNDGCIVIGGSKNGTCYTPEECTGKGGTASGTCASGFGVCCTISLGCGGISKENTTYFEQLTTIPGGPCTAKICKVSPNICQMRLDFDTFIITGPSTGALTVAKAINGVIGAVDQGKEVSYNSVCLTDTFVVTHQSNLPTLCGTLTGQHVYFEASDSCHDLVFQFNPVATGTLLASRSFSVKVSQYSCTFSNLAPIGCDQYYYGEPGSGIVQTFNFDKGFHLGGQHQDICIRREIRRCRLCFYAADIDVSLSGTAAAYKHSASCCNYGTKGDSTNYDCLMIPGAEKLTKKAGDVSQCGLGFGVMNKASTCTTSVPFRVSFISDNFEFLGEIGVKGFKLSYLQEQC